MYRWTPPPAKSQYVFICKRFCGEDKKKGGKKLPKKKNEM